MKVEQFLVGEMANFTYVIVDEKNKDSIIVDPSWNLEIIFEYLKRNSLSNRYIINTHSHFDHIFGNEQVKSITGAKVIQHKLSPLEKDIEVDEGEFIEFGDSKIKIIHTPGHSRDSICLIIDDKVMLTGDTVFVGSCGRLDLPGGNPHEMFDSIYSKLANLAGNLTILPGHHYGSSKTSTLQKEFESNFVFKFKEKDDFLRSMSS
ncbi:MAG: MBL fold metallo-hydrolase [Thermoproteota archaeon]|nr:MBL fold metallo-hydrolase [Thermoproteota archaeon]